MHIQFKKTDTLEFLSKKREDNISILKVINTIRIKKKEDSKYSFIEKE